MAGSSNESGNRTIVGILVLAAVAGLAFFGWRWMNRPAPPAAVTAAPAPVQPAPQPEPQQPQQPAAGNGDKEQRLPM